MALLSPGMIQGLAAGFGGDQLLTDLAMKKLQLKAGADQLKTQEASTSANKVWSRAIMDVLAGSGQTPVAPPIAPQPGQASVPMTQGAAGVPATPTAAGLGGPGAAGAPGQAGPAGQPNPALAVMGGAPPAAPNNTPSAATGGPLDVSTILQNIKDQNPDLDPGVMSAIVNDHIMPLLGQQQQNQYKQFQQQLELSKLSNEQQNKANELYFKYQQLEEMSQNKQLDREARLQIAQMSDAIRQELVNMRAQTLAQQQPLIDSQIEKNKAAAAASQQKSQSQQNAMGTGGPKFQAMKAELESLKTMVGDAYQQVRKDPGVVGAVGMVKRGVQAVEGWVSPSSSTSGSQFSQTIMSLQDRVSKLLQRGYLSKDRADRLNDEIQGLGVLDNPNTTKASLSRLYKDLDDLTTNLGTPGVSGGTPSPTQIDPQTNEPMAGGDSGGGLPPAGSKYTSVGDLVKAVQNGQMTQQDAIDFASKYPKMPQ